MNANKHKHTPKYPASPVGKVYKQKLHASTILVACRQLPMCDQSTAYMSVVEHLQPKR